MHHEGGAIGNRRRVVERQGGNTQETLQDGGGDNDVESPQEYMQMQSDAGSPYQEDG